MKEYLEQIRKQLAKLPGSPFLEYESPKSCTMALSGFLVIVDYQKRKGLKLSSAVFTFRGDGPSPQMRAFLREEFKRKKKKNANGGLDWDGDDEVLYVQSYPKGIIEDNQHNDFAGAISAFQKTLVVYRRKLMDAQAGRTSETLANGSLKKESEDDSNECRRNEMRTSSSKATKNNESKLQRSFSESSTGSCSAGKNVEPERKFPMFGRRKKKNDETAFALLEDSDVVSD